MIRITQIKLKIDDDLKLLSKKISKILGISENEFTYKVVRRSIDARKGDVNYVYSVDILLKNKKESFIMKKVNNKNVMLTNSGKYKFDTFGNIKMNSRPVIVGSGPAGLFCGYMLAKSGYKPIIIERGEDVDHRRETVDKFFKTGKLNTESNVQFGEGGAGTFSDGKLNTLVKDRLKRNTFVLETFVKYGASEEIIYDSKPHIGTDVLSEVVKNIRNAAIEYGAEFRFNTKLTHLIEKNGKLEALEYETNNMQEQMPCETLVLAIGHSSRDTFKMLNDMDVYMTPKAFAVGIRIEHSREMIDKDQYGAYYNKLPAASYKLTKNLENNRGVYSFCMCPGGYIVNSSSEEGMLAVNGMSYSKRDGSNSNSAIICTVKPEDFKGQGALAGVEFQRELERKAYKIGNGMIPVQLYGDFKENRISTGFGEIIPQTKGEYILGNVREIFPEFISQSIIRGIDSFGHKIKGYDREDSIISGVESRTSSPLRIERDESFQSNIKGVYPCGEGAGYAGGITSAAIDGIKVFEAIASVYEPF